MLRNIHKSTSKLPYVLTRQKHHCIFYKMEWITAYEMNEEKVKCAYTYV